MKLSETALTLFALSGDFEHFLEGIGLDPDHPVVKKFFLEKILVAIESEYRHYVIAWSAWMLGRKSKLIWMKTNPRIRILQDEFLLLLEAIDFVNQYKVLSSRSHSIYTRGGSIRITSTSKQAIIGFRLTDAIFENVNDNHLSKLANDLTNRMTSRHSELNKIIWLK